MVNQPVVQAGIDREGPSVRQPRRRRRTEPKRNGMGRAFLFFQKSFRGQTNCANTIHMRLCRYEGNNSKPKRRTRKSRYVRTAGLGQAQYAGTYSKPFSLEGRRDVEIYNHRRRIRARKPSTTSNQKRIQRGRICCAKPVEPRWSGNPTFFSTRDVQPAR